MLLLPLVYHEFTYSFIFQYFFILILDNAPFRKIDNICFNSYSEVDTVQSTILLPQSTCHAYIRLKVVKKLDAVYFGII